MALAVGGAGEGAVDAAATAQGDADSSDYDDVAGLPLPAEVRSSLLLWISFVRGRCGMVQRAGQAAFFYTRRCLILQTSGCVFHIPALGVLRASVWPSAQTRGAIHGVQRDRACRRCGRLRQWTACAGVIGVGVGVGRGGRGGGGGPAAPARDCGGQAPGGGAIQKEEAQARCGARRTAASGAAAVTLLAWAANRMAAVVLRVTCDQLCSRLPV